MPTKILAIDDSKTMRLAIKITFAAEDAEVVAVSKGSEAVARAKQMGADVILVDHALADGEPSGYDVVRTLKTDGDTGNTPVILMVPARNGPPAADITACGADGSIGKPFDSQELVDKVGSVIGKPVAKPTAAASPAAKPAATPAPTPTPVAAAKPAPATPPKAATPSPKIATPPPAAKPASKPPSGPSPMSKPAGKPSSGPTLLGKPGMAPRPASQPAAAAAAATPAASSGTIPVVRPIPFTAAGSPTPGILKRLQEASGGGAAAGLDPQAVQALLTLTHEVVEQVVWEVVPELAEELIKQKAQ